jgi:hypothetical protein
MNEQLTKESEKRTVEMKTDVLGRVKSSTDKTEPKTKVAESKQKRLVLVSDMHLPQIEMEPMQGRYEYNSKTKESNYYLNDKKVNAKEYESSIEKHYDKLSSQNKGKRNLSIPGVISSEGRSWTAWMTAEEISELVKKYKELAISDYTEPIAEASIVSILSKLQLTQAHSNYEGYGVGVYVMEPGCRNTSIPIYRQNRYTNNCTGSTDIHHSAVVNVVQHAAPLAHIFGFRTSTTYPNPNSYSPNIYIGTHSYGWTTGYSYSDQDMNMDNHIYTDRIINFKSAGNAGESTGYITSPGKALNIITVGAVEPATDRYASYSSWRNSDVGNEKPELGMYTDIEMGIFNPYSFPFNGTSAASPLAAGFTAVLLEQHPFFRMQPALTKAVLLTGQTSIPIIGASSWDTDNWYGAARGITTYSSVGSWWTRSAWWSGGNSSHFNSNREIRFTENNIQANRRYRIAISWLIPGSYILDSTNNPSKAPPQDIDLWVEQNGVKIANSRSSRNPYEVVDFVTTSNAPLTIIIERYSNSGTGDVLLGYHMMDNVP